MSYQVLELPDPVRVQQGDVDRLITLFTSFLNRGHTVNECQFLAIKTLKTMKKAAWEILTDKQQSGQKL